MLAPRRTPPDFRRIPVLACVLLVTLRLFIGWQFLYEGLWKVDAVSSTQPWTSAGFLKNAQGPFRDMFRNMTGDPDDLSWLDQQQVERKWDDWAARFADHYRLSEAQRSRLDVLLNGPESFQAELAALPKGVTLPKKLRDTVRFDPQVKRLIVSGKQHLWPAEKEALLALVKSQVDAETPAPGTPAASDPQVEAFKKAVEDVFKRANQLSFKERLTVALGPSDPNRVRLVFSNFKGTLGERAPEKVDTYYRQLLANYEERARTADTEFQKERLARDWAAIQKLRAELVNPIRALDAELKTQAREMLSDEQFALGSLPEPWTPQRRADWMAIAGLVILGFLLIAGLGTRAAAVLGAVMVLSFYLVWPPWPGVPVDPGPEHSYIVNKNLIEVVALLAIAAMPTGQWFGVDGLIYRGWRWFAARRSSAPAAAPARPVPAVAGK